MTNDRSAPERLVIRYHLVSDHVLWYASDEPARVSLLSLPIRDYLLEASQQLTSKPEVVESNAGDVTSLRRLFAGAAGF